MPLVAGDDAVVSTNEDGSMRVLVPAWFWDVTDMAFAFLQVLVEELDEAGTNFTGQQLDAMAEIGRASCRERVL